jgi:hypothetical protein
MINHSKACQFITPSNPPLEGALYPPLEARIYDITGDHHAA